jgi:hypothetical protein
MATMMLNGVPATTDAVVLAVASALPEAEGPLYIVIVNVSVPTSAVKAIEHVRIPAEAAHNGDVGLTS